MAKGHTRPRRYRDYRKRPGQGQERERRSLRAERAPPYLQQTHVASYPMKPSALLACPIPWTIGEKCLAHSPSVSPTDSDSVGVGCLRLA